MVGNNDSFSSLFQKNNLFNLFNGNRGEFGKWLVQNGKFESEVYSETVATVKIIEFADVDGELNGGEFATTSITTSQMQTTKVKDGNGGWYRGEFNRKADIKLSPKEADKEELE